MSRLAFSPFHGSGFEPAMPQKVRNRDISFTPGFSPVSNDEKKRKPF